MTTPNRRLAQRRPEGGFALRIYHRRQTARRGPRYLIKCGCCDEKVEIDYDSKTLEINGVIGTLENWREVLLPLLFPDQPLPELSSLARPSE